MAEQYTKINIHKVFIEELNKKPLSKITVKDIAELCNINRNTFYYYYSDIYELLSEIFQMQLEKVIEKFNERLSWEDSCIMATSIALDNKKAIYHIYNSMRRQELIDYIYNVAGNVMTRYIDKINENIDSNQDDKKLIVSFYQCALSEMVLRWIANGMVEDPEYVIRKIGMLFDGNIEISLKRS